MIGEIYNERLHQVIGPIAFLVIHISIYKCLGCFVPFLFMIEFYLL